MTVYVDDMFRHPIGQFGRMKMSHMFADTDEELHAMADRIGIARRWHQNKRWSHYDVSMSKRAAAIAAGAVAITYGRQLVEITRQIEERRRMVAYTQELTDEITAAQFAPPAIAWPIDACYDVESFPNFASCVIVPLDPDHDEAWRYEISPRCDHSLQLYRAFTGGYFRRLYGFRNEDYDWPVVMAFLKWFEAGAAGGWQGAVDAFYRKTEAIMAESGFGRGWSHRVKPWEKRVTQVDLSLLHHFDNPSRTTSLKTLQVNMRMESVEDMPVQTGVPVPLDKMDIVLDYNEHDTRSTKLFAHHSHDMIAFREQLIAAGTFGEECLSFNDTKIGKQILIRRLEARQPGICFEKGNDGGKRPRQTWRNDLPLADVILPWIRLDHPALAATLQQLKDTTLHCDTRTGKLQTKGVLSLTPVVDGFTFALGTGGIHGSVERKIFRATDRRPIVDIDVSAFYPRIAIVNKIAPAHLGVIFVEEYKWIYDTRMAVKRLLDRTALQNAEVDALKLAGNGVYGDSNQVNSPFYDPAYTMAITVNGQLLQLMLAEVLMRIPSLTMIQINTDGITFQVDADQLGLVESVKDWWIAGTAMELEQGYYREMYVRDVNSYIAVGMDGKIKKLTNAYDYELRVGKQHAWHKDHSGLVIPRAAVAAMTEDVDPLHYLQDQLDRDPWNFLLRQKSEGRNYLELASGERLPKTVRYFVADDHTGQTMFKMMPPLAGKGPDWRRSIVHAEGQSTCSGGRGAWRCDSCGHATRTKEEFQKHNQLAHSWKVKTCNVFKGDLTGIDLRYYLRETEKLLIDA